MKLTIIGADGQIGTDLAKLLPEAIGLTINDVNISDFVLSHKVITKLKPELVINTAAYHNVDLCEDNPEIAFNVNAVGPKNLALICKEINAKLVHISTDYIFSGDKGAPYEEGDLPNPTSVYGRSKLEGEQNVQQLLPEHYIIRTCGLYGAAGCMGKGGTNFVEGMIKRAKSDQTIKVVNDEIVSPTYSYDLAKKILEVIKTNSYGIYHITNSGQCSWYEFAVKIFEYLGITIPVVPVSGEEFKAKAKRPKYSVLAHGHLQRLGMDNMRSWQEALQAYLKEKGYA